ncbi:unnamed protein product [Urochloa humidicola]
MEALRLRKKKHARRLAEARAKMELRSTKQSAEKEMAAEREERANKMEEDMSDWDKMVEREEMEEREEMAGREERAKMELRDRWQMEMRYVREALEQQARFMGKPVADHNAGSEEGKPNAGSSEEGKPVPVAAEPGSKQGKRKKTKMVRLKLNQAGVEGVMPFRRRPPFPGRMPDWMFDLAPEEIRQEELKTRALVEESEAFNEDFYRQYCLKGYVEVEATVEVNTDDDEPGVQE